MFNLTNYIIYFTIIKIIEFIKNKKSLIKKDNEKKKKN